MFKKIIAVFILLILPTMGLPHSPLKLSNPIDGASLSKAPTEYKMLFKSPAKLIKFEIFKKGKNDNKDTSLLKSLFKNSDDKLIETNYKPCLLYTSPSPRDMRRSRMPSSA